MTPSERLKEIENNKFDHALSSVALEEKKWLIARCKKLTEALEFYAEAKILFISKNGKMPKSDDENIGILGGFEATETHIKDDGQRARKALEDEC